MNHSLPERLLLIAQQFEDQHAPQNITTALREAVGAISDLVAANDSMAYEIDRLRAALEPFASQLRGNWSHQNDSMVIVAGPFHTDMRMDFTLGDFRRARAALEGK